MKRITIDKLNIYRKYGGDIDDFARTGQEIEKQNFSSNDWELIDNFVQSLTLINNGLTSDGFASSTLEKLAELADEQAFKQMTKSERLG